MLCTLGEAHDLVSALSCLDDRIACVLLYAADGARGWTRGATVSFAFGKPNGGYSELELFTLSNAFVSKHGLERFVSHA
jgi:hypothetical protein